LDSVPVSVIIPAYNEARRLPGSLPPLLSAMRRIPGAEVIVVDDGSTDGTAAIAEECLAGMPGGRVLRLPWNSGKGAAVRAGVSVAHGASIVFLDADGASDVADLPLLLAALEHAEVALGSRRIGAGATRSSGRRVGSWAFNQITRSLASLDVADTQCGFKAFRGPEAKLLFSLARSSGFGFDVEVLSIARSIGYRIAEVPIRWAEIPGGTFRVTRHTPAMIVDVMRARRYLGRAAPGLVVAPSAAPAGPTAPAPAGATPPPVPAPAGGTPASVPTPATAAPTAPGPASVSPPAPASVSAPASNPVAAASARPPLSPPRRPAAGAVAPSAARHLDGDAPADVPTPVAAATTIDRPGPGVSRPGTSRQPAEDTVVAIPSPSAEPTPTVALAGALGAVLTAGGARGSLGPGGTGTDGVNRHTPA
jgi:dolichyl-phosphate beta-glucosyltransferase